MADNSEKWNRYSKGFKQYIKLEKGLSDNTVEAYMRDYTSFAGFILRKYDVAPTKVEQYMVERYLAFLFEECKHAKASQARELSGVKAFFNYLLVNDKIPRLRLTANPPPFAREALLQRTSILAAVGWHKIIHPDY